MYLTKRYSSAQMKKNDVGRTCLLERRGIYRVLVGKPEGKNHLKKLGIDERMILNLI